LRLDCAKALNTLGWLLYLPDSVNYSNAQEKGRTSNKRKFNRNLMKSNLTQGLRTPVDRDLSQPARTSSPDTLKENAQFATIRITLLISVPILTRLDPLLRSRRDLHLRGEKKKEMMGMSFP
jgi:hypothetical protein